MYVIENQPVVSAPKRVENKLEILHETRQRDKIDELMESETRGTDSKGNIRYFCPMCNVRYSEYSLTFNLESLS